MKPMRRSSFCGRIHRQPFRSLALLTGGMFGRAWSDAAVHLVGSSCVVPAAAVSILSAMCSRSEAMASAGVYVTRYHTRCFLFFLSDWHSLLLNLVLQHATGDCQEFGISAFPLPNTYHLLVSICRCCWKLDSFIPVSTAEKESKRSPVSVCAVHRMSQKVIDRFEQNFVEEKTLEEVIKCWDLSAFRSGSGIIFHFLTLRDRIFLTYRNVHRLVDLFCVLGVIPFIPLLAHKVCVMEHKCKKWS